MATWQTINGNDLPIISDIEEVAQLVEPAVSTINTAANAAATALGVASTILDLVPTPDPFEILRNAIDELIASIANTSVNALYVRPEFLNTRRRGLATFVSRINDSLLDEADPQRPIFGPTDQSAGVVFLFSAPSFRELEQVALLVQRLFGRQWNDLLDFISGIEDFKAVPVEFIDAVGTITGFPEGGDQRNTFLDDLQASSNAIDTYTGRRITILNGKNAERSSQITSFNSFEGLFTLAPQFNIPLEVGNVYTLSYAAGTAPPDWTQRDLVDIVPPIGDALEALGRVRDSLPTGNPLASIKQVLQNVLDLLQQKAETLRQITRLLVQLIETLENLGDLVNISILPVPPQNAGNSGFINELITSTNKPPLADEAVVMGLVLYGGSGIYPTLQRLFPL